MSPAAGRAKSSSIRSSLGDLLARGALGAVVCGDAPAWTDRHANRRDIRAMPGADAAVVAHADQAGVVELGDHPGLAGAFPDGALYGEIHAERRAARDAGERRLRVRVRGFTAGSVRSMRGLGLMTRSAQAAARLTPAAGR